MPSPAEHIAVGRVLEVSPPEAPQELLEFLSSRFINESKTSLRRSIAGGEVRVNGRAMPPSHLMQAGDRVRVPDELDAAPPPAHELDLTVLFEDAEHLCIDKPPHYPVLPGRLGQKAQLFHSLTAHVNRYAPPGGPYCRPHVVHRLDTQTSGVLLVAKNVAAGRALSEQFQRRQTEKTYLAIVEGVFPDEHVSVELPIKRKSGSVVEMNAHPNEGKAAVTQLWVEKRFGHFTLMRARPHTGRQHQIRIHLAATGYPLAVDHLYGRRCRLDGAQLNAIVGGRARAKHGPALDRCPLHAASIRYAHPATGEPMSQEAPLPEDLRRFVNLLEHEDPA